MTKIHLMKNYLLRMAQSLYITEIYRLWQPNCAKLKMDICQKFLMKFLLVKQSHYNLRQRNDFRIPSIRTVYHGSGSISFLGPKIWNILPDEFNHQTSLNSFKKSVKKLKPQNCPCRLCNVHINGFGFLFQLS